MKEEIQAEKVKKIIEDFKNENLPEYILEKSRHILSENGIQKLSTRKNEDTWNIESNVNSDDLQFYHTEIDIQLTENMLSYFCNCPNSFAGVCPHVGATLEKILASFKTDQNKQEETVPQADWRKQFRGFFATAPEPEQGQQYIVFEFHPERERLMVDLFRARQNKTGLSTVRSEITLEQIIHNPEWSEISPNLPKVADQIGKYIDYYGHRIEIPTGLLNWFLWTIHKEYYLFWKDSIQPVRIETSPMRLQLSPSFSESGLTFQIMLGREGKPPVAIDGHDVFLYGQMPLWIFWKHCFYPIQTGLPSKLIQELISTPAHIRHEDISEFLDRVWTKISVADLYGQEEFLEKMQPNFIKANYNPRLYLDEEGSLLTLQVQNSYDTVHGEIPLPGPNPDFQTGSYQYDGKSYLLQRDRQAEEELIIKLQNMDFQPRNTAIWFLEPEEAINFLLDHYPSLIERYRVYGEKNLQRYKIRLTTPNIVAKIESEDDKWFNLDIQVEYDDISVPIEKIWKAWTQKKRYIQLKDGSYTGLPESWLKILKYKLQTMGFDPEKPPKKRFESFEAPALDKIIEDIPETNSDDFWKKLRTKIHQFKEIQQLTQPKELNATLRPYQLQGMSYMNFLREYHFGGILADEMGLGKTVQTLSFLQYMKECGCKGPNLIIIPTSVLPNWEREAQKFVPGMSRLVIYGAKRENMFKQIANTDLILTTYALLRRDLDEILKFEFNSIILDEAQNIKNPNTITARSVRKLNARFKLCLSGTPIENSLLELWSLFEFLMPGFLGTQHSFQKGFVKPIKDGDEDSLKYLKTRVTPFILRRTKSEVAKDLPPKIENTYYCALADEQLELYASLAKKLKTQVMQTVDEKGIAKSQISILDALLKLRQICCHPNLLKMNIPGVNTFLPSGKFEAFKDLLNGIVEDGHKVLVFSQFVEMLKIIRAWLETTEMPYAYLDGTSKDRFEQVDRFNNSPDIPVFLISLKAGGTGLNLTSADYVIHYDPWWNPAVENQATDRTHRIGQTRQVFSYKMICENTVEEKILKLQDQKRGIADSIIPGQNSWKNLTRSDLELLFEV